MKKILRIAKTELQTLFYSPVAWLILVVFAFQSGFIISNNFVDIARRKELGQFLWSLSGELFLFQALKGYLYLYLPLLTMGVISREYASGSIKLLYSSPVSNLQIVLGKYLSMVAYGLALLLLLVPYIVLGGIMVKDFQVMEALVPMLGLFLLICAYTAIGLFTSSLTSYQVVAAMCTLAVLALLNYVGKIGQDIPFVRDLTYWLWLPGKADSFIAGLISSQDLLYFIIVICLFLALTVIRFQTIKKSIPWYFKTAKYVGTVLIAVLLGYISSRPKMIGYYDVTYTKSNTLTVGSQEIMKNVTGGLTITTYVNLFHPTFREASPEQYNRDKDRFIRYVRFKPEMELKYVYYYRKPEVKVMTPAELKAEREEAKKICETVGMDFDLFLSPDQIDKLIDLSAEKYQLTRVIERESGEKNFLRIYNDLQQHPTEREITAAFKRVSMKLPKIGYIQGYGQRGLNDYSDRGFSNLMTDPASRYSMVNQGMDVVEVNLSYGEDIPDEISLIVIADGKVPFDAEATAKLMKFVQRGGNMILLGDINHQPALNPLISQFGARFLPGELVQSKNLGLPNTVFGNRTPASNKLSYIFDNFKYGDVRAILPGAVAIVPEPNKGFQFTPLFVTDSVGSWNELNTVNFIDEVPALNDPREEEKSNTVVALLQRKLGANTQNIFIVGDADCLSNAGITKRYSGVYAANEELTNGMLDYISKGAVPINIERTRPLDIDMDISLKGSSAIKIFAMYILPALLAIGSAILLIIRKRK